MCECFQNGARRRTPGGVYLMLAKEDDQGHQEKVAALFRDHQREQWKAIRVNKKQQRKERLASNPGLAQIIMQDKLLGNR